MKETPTHQLTINFEANYTLDILCFIDILLNQKEHKERDVIEQFYDWFSERSHRTFKKIKKKLPKDETLESLVIPLVMADSDFKNLKPVELFKCPKYLITKFKKSPQFKQVTKTMKSWIKQDAEFMIEELCLIIEELERAKFKSFWLSQRLPQLKQSIKKLEQEIMPLNMIERLNNWVHPSTVESICFYALSFSSLQICNVLNGDYTVSLTSDSGQIIRKLVEEKTQPVEINRLLKSKIKPIKADLQELFKEVKNDHKHLHAYLQDNFLIALQTYLNEQFHAVTQPHYYLKTYHYGTHKLSVLFYDYMSMNPKAPTQPLVDYFADLLEVVDLKQVKDV